VDYAVSASIEIAYAENKRSAPVPYGKRGAISRLYPELIVALLAPAEETPFGFFVRFAVIFLVRIVLIGIIM